MVLRIGLQPEMAQGPDDQRRLLAYRHALDCLDSRRAIHYRAQSPGSGHAIRASGRSRTRPQWWTGSWRGHAHYRSKRQPCWGELDGIDYELIYILDTSIFGHGDWGQFTYTVNGTWLSRFELQVNPDQNRFGIAGQFVPSGFALTSSLPRNRAFLSLFYHGPHDSWMNGLDVGATVHWTSQYDDDLLEGFDRKVREWTTLDLLASYTFNMPAPVAQQEVPGYSKDGGKNVKMKDGKDKNVMPVSTATYSECGWRAWLNGRQLSRSACRMCSMPIRRLLPERSRTITTNRWLMSEAGSGTSA